MGASVLIEVQHASRMESGMYVGSSVRANLMADFERNPMRIKGDSGTTVDLSFEPDGRLRVLVNGGSLAYTIVDYKTFRDAVNNLPPKQVKSAEPEVETPQASEPSAEETAPPADEPPADAEKPEEKPAAKPKRAVRAKRPSGVLNPKPEDV